MPLRTHGGINSPFLHATETLIPILAPQSILLSKMGTISSKYQEKEVPTKKNTSLIGYSSIATSCLGLYTL